MTAEARSAEILLVEDNEHDVILTREAFKQAAFHARIEHARDGEACMEYLRERTSAGSSLPDLVLLDLNMPLMGGREVLSSIISDPKLRHLPVIILTTSSEEQDVLSMYRMRCSSYITKPIDFNEFVGIVQELRRYWFSTVSRPSGAVTA